MLISRKTQVFSAALLALSISACTTTKKADDGAQATAGSAVTNSTATEQVATSAASTSNNLNSQSLANNANSGLADKANDLAAYLGIKTFRFDYDSSSISSNDYNALKAHAAYLNKNPSARVRVEGNTDERGTREYNMALGERRAKSVAAFLTSNGAKANQLDIISFGEEKPVATGDDESAWAQNRRVDLEYTSAKP